jgi:hypothetical protein
MKTIRKIPILAVLLSSLILISCQDEQLFNNNNAEDASIVTRSAESNDPFLDYLLSPAFADHLLQIGLDKLISDGLNLEVIDYHTVIQTDPFDPNDLDIDPADPYPPGVIIKILSEGDGKWPFLPTGVYFLDLDSGWIYDVWGHIMNPFSQVPPR